MTDAMTGFCPFSVNGGFGGSFSRFGAGGRGTGGKPYSSAPSLAKAPGAEPKSPCACAAM